MKCFLSKMLSYLSLSGTMLLCVHKGRHISKHVFSICCVCKYFTLVNNIQGNFTFYWKSNKIESGKIIFFEKN